MQNKKQTTANFNIIPTNPMGSPNPIDIYIGKRICYKRSTSSYNRQAFADLLGIPENLLDKMERGTEKIPVALLWYIAALLEVDISYFFEEIKPDKSTWTFILDEPDTFILTD